MRGEKRCLPDRCRAPQEGKTHWATMVGHAAVAELLLAAGADLEAKNTVKGEGG